MSLKLAFAKVQNTGAKFYLKLAQLFVENQLIHDSWVAMARDMEQQAASLVEIPPGFWKMFKRSEEVLLKAVRECSDLQAFDKNEDKSLHHCYVRTLNLEEPLILNTYVPLIRLLRTELSDHALDFYIMVKSHVTRIARIIQPFSVDPMLLQRVQNLQQRFEFEVQAPEIPVRPKSAQKKKGRKQRALAGGPRKKAQGAIRASRSAERTLSLGKRVQSMAKRAKPLVGKLGITRRRARR